MAFWFVLELLLDAFVFLDLFEILFLHFSMLWQVFRRLFYFVFSFTIGMVLVLLLSPSGIGT